jgi:hypothetical protein
MFHPNRVLKAVPAVSHYSSGSKLGPSCHSTCTFWCALHIKIWYNKHTCARWLYTCFWWCMYACFHLRSIWIWWMFYLLQVFKWPTPICDHAIGTLYFNTNYGHNFTIKIHTFSVLAVVCRSVHQCFKTVNSFQTTNLLFVGGVNSMVLFFWTGLYVLAKLEEFMDKKIYRWTNYGISGHTMQHLCSFMVLVLITVILARRNTKIER